MSVMSVSAPLHKMEIANDVSPPIQGLRAFYLRWGLPFMLDERRIQQLQAWAANKRRRGDKNGQRRAALARWDEGKAKAATERHRAILARLGPIAAAPLDDAELEARIAFLQSNHDT